jgi:tetratricopeptide (TPR) repeat protein
MAGDVVEAEHLCRQVLATQNDFFDAIHLFAFVQARLGRNEAALASYDRALELRPDDAMVLYRRGTVLRDLKRFDEAVASYERALELQPQDAELLCRCGTALYELQRFEQALASFDLALEQRPDHARALCNRGATLYELQRFEEALASYDRALEQRPDYVVALCNRGTTLRELKRFEEASASFGHVLELQPDNTRGLYCRAAVLHELKRFDEALATCNRAIEIDPDCVEALSNRGRILTDLLRLDEALVSHDRALALRPNYPPALANRAVTLNELKRFEEARASYARALELQPGFKQARFDDALCHLLIGDFERGWQWFGNRVSRRLAQPMWLGQGDLAGRTILLFPEEGLGDTIQFCRYVPFVAQRGARVVLEVQPPLRGLLGSLGGAAQIISGEDPLPDFDVHCPLHALPLAFGTRLETIPFAGPYLRASPRAVDRWCRRLGPRSGPRIGLTWAGDPKHRSDHKRSMRLSDVLPLFDVGGAELVSLQRDLRPGDAAMLSARGGIADFCAELKDFSDTAALISNLDLVISVDTSVAHLAGALAKPVWVMLPFVPEWRWLLDRDDSPWYPTARLFRQDETRTWENVVARVRAALSEFVRHQARLSGAMA